MERITPSFITKLKDNEIFVFPSNLSGFHGAGAAKMALNFGAEYGNPVGPQGNTYAIPTKSKWIKNTLSITEIKQYVDEFLIYAQQPEHATKIFYVTEIGCGLAGLKPRDVAPLFKEAIYAKNIYLPQNFIDVIKKLNSNE